jgi:hypothetical protein
MKQLDLQLDRQKAELAAQVDQHRNQIEAQRAEQDRQHQAQLEQMKAQFDDQKHQRDLQFQQWKAELDASTKVRVAEIAAKASLNASLEADEDYQRFKSEMEQGSGLEGVKQELLGTVKEIVSAAVPKEPTHVERLRGPDGSLVGIRKHYQDGTKTEIAVH